MQHVNILLVSCISAAVAIGLACDASQRDHVPPAGGIAGNLAMLVDGEDDEQPRVDDEQPRADDEQPRADDEQPRANDEQPGANDEQPRADDEQPRTNDEQPRANDEQPRANDEPPGAPPSPANPCEGVTCEWGQTCGGDGACHSVCAPNQATCKTSESPNASYTCCNRQCGATGGCDDTPPPSAPSCTGGSVACGHVCCPILHACVNATTGQCQVDF